ncbi:MarR family winged helix-turn-helix transcriptional regulator [Roseateles koreensis]|uniref:MarR family transcriptional regulator n=1 Tax=Roseateles koreensis TaxID=2987526 RepID=A0ABT5KP18_9BURK|nr:MarR family transcriptional regulator [Roseateles koreensis]MDC8784667.1 MarR family transcriptional regulator [Roseateles koreensis]
MPKPAPDALSLDLYDQPGHLVRRAQQIAVSMFFEAVAPATTTPIQYAILRTLQEKPGIDQVTLAQEIALDSSTTAETAARLEAKGLIGREVMARRQRRLTLTPAGEALLTSLIPAVHRMRAAMLSSMEPAEQKEFIRLLRKFVHLNNDQSRAPKGGKVVDRADDAAA